MQVVSVVSTLPAVESVSSDSGHGNSASQGDSFADKLGASMGQDTQTQQTQAAAQPEQGQENQTNGLTPQQEAASAQAQEQPGTQNVPAVSDEKIAVCADLILAVDQENVSADETSTAEIDPDAVSDAVSETDSEEDSQDAVPDQEPQMVYFSPFLFNQSNLKQTDEIVADSGVEPVSAMTDVTKTGNSQMPQITDVPETANLSEASAIPETSDMAEGSETEDMPEISKTSVQLMGSASENSGAVQTEFNLSATGTGAFKSQDATTKSLPQSDTVQVDGQANGETLISRITQALLSQDDSMTGNTGGENPEQFVLTQETDDTLLQTEDTAVPINTTTFAVQVEDGLEGKTAAVEEIIDRFTQDFKGAESCPGEISITLTPEELGELKISIRVSEQGGVTAHITSKDKDICALISGQIGRLIETMEQKGVAVEDVDVVYDQMSGNQSFGQKDDQGQQDARSKTGYTAETQQASADSEDVFASDPVQYVNTKVISTGNLLSS